MSNETSTLGYQSLALKALSLLFALTGVLATLLWQDLRQSVSLLELEVKGIDKRLSIMESAQIERIEKQRELRDTINIVSVQVSRIEKGLIRKGIIKP